MPYPTMYITKDKWGYILNSNEYFMIVGDIILLHSVIMIYYPSHTSTLTRIEYEINIICRVYHGIVHMVSGADSG